MTVSPVCTITSVCTLRLSTLMLSPMVGPSTLGELTSWVMSMNTMPLLLILGLTFSVTPVCRNCTWL